MDLSTILELAQDQGIVFWGAAAAIALGATLLVVALAQQIRGLLAGRLQRRSQPATSAIPVAGTPATEVSTPPAAVMTTSDDLYVPTTASLASRPIAAGEEPSLALLLRRLQSAGDRLEEIAGEIQTSRGEQHETMLKDDLQEVEYVFKACAP